MNELTSDECDVPITTIAKLCMAVTDRRPMDKGVKTVHSALENFVP